MSVPRSLLTSSSVPGAVMVYRANSAYRLFVSNPIPLQQLRPFVRIIQDETMVQIEACLQCSTKSSITSSLDMSIKLGAYQLLPFFIHFKNFPHFPD